MIRPNMQAERELKPRDECLYYLVREMGGLGPRAEDIYFEDVLEHVRRSGLAGMRPIEESALINAAYIRDRLKDLDMAVEGGSSE